MEQYEIAELLLELDDESVVEEKYYEPHFRDGPGTDLPPLERTYLSRHVRATRAAYELAKLGPEAIAAVPSLIRRLRDAWIDPKLKVAIMRALARIGARDDTAVFLICEQLRSTDAYVRRAAIDSLAAITAARAVAREIVKLIRDDTVAVVAALNVMAPTDWKVLRSLCRVITWKGVPSLVVRIVSQDRTTLGVIDRFLRPSREHIIRLLIARIRRAHRTLPEAEAALKELSTDVATSW